jgi:hypothetical protein
VTKQSYIYYSFHVVLYFLFYIHHRIKNVFKHVLFNMHDIKIMAEEISLLIRKLSKNTLFYQIMGHTKTRKLLLARLKIKHIIIILRLSYNSSLDATSNAITFSTLPTNKSFFFSFCTYNQLAKTTGGNKKKKALYHHLLR